MTSSRRFDDKSQVLAHLVDDDFFGNGLVSESGIKFGGVDVKQRTVDIKIQDALSFPDLLLSPAVTQGLESAGFKKPSPVQLESIPVGRAGLDLLVQAKSGTGKTCVFAVISLEAVKIDVCTTQVLILTPTREIADQAYNCIITLGKFIPNLHCCVFVGGTDLKTDQRKCKGCQIAVGTPGRICQLVKEGYLNIDSIRLYVLDEADQLMHESFKEHIDWLFEKLPVNKQFIVLSATYPSGMNEALLKYMRSPVKVQINADDVQLLGVKQYFSVIIGQSEDSGTSKNPLVVKVRALHELLSKISFNQCLIFCSSQTRTEAVCEHMKELGWPAEFISASLEQKQRRDLMSSFKGFQCRLLVSTDLTARGIDAENVNLVINFDVPLNQETYLHRIGRAGRYGSFGSAITLLLANDDEQRFYCLAAKSKFHCKKLSDSLPNDLVTNAQFWQGIEDAKFSELLKPGYKWLSPSGSKLQNGSADANFSKQPVKALCDQDTKRNILKTTGKLETPQSTVNAATGAHPFSEYIRSDLELDRFDGRGFGIKTTNSETLRYSRLDMLSMKPDPSELTTCGLSKLPVDIRITQAQSATNIKPVNMNVPDKLVGVTNTATRKRGSEPAKGFPGLGLDPLVPEKSEVSVPEEATISAKRLQGFGPNHSEKSHVSISEDSDSAKLNKKTGDVQVVRYAREEMFSVFKQMLKQAKKLKKKAKKLKAKPQQMQQQKYRNTATSLNPGPKCHTKEEIDSNKVIETVPIGIGSEPNFEYTREQLYEIYQKMSASCLNNLVFAGAKVPHRCKRDAAQVLEPRPSIEYSRQEIMEIQQNSKQKAENLVFTDTYAMQQLARRHLGPSMSDEHFKPVAGSINASAHKNQQQNSWFRRNWPQNLFDKLPKLPSDQWPIFGDSPIPLPAYSGPVYYTTLPEIIEIRKQAENDDCIASVRPINEVAKSLKVETVTIAAPTERPSSSSVHQTVSQRCTKEVSDMPPIVVCSVSNSSTLHTDVKLSSNPSTVLRYDRDLLFGIQDTSKQRPTPKFVHKIPRALKTAEHYTEKRIPPTNVLPHSATTSSSDLTDGAFCVDSEVVYEKSLRPKRQANAKIPPVSSASAATTSQTISAPVKTYEQLCAELLNAVTRDIPNFSAATFAEDVCAKDRIQRVADCASHVSNTVDSAKLDFAYDLALKVACADPRHLAAVNRALQSKGYRSVQTQTSTAEMCSKSIGVNIEKETTSKSSGTDAFVLTSQVLPCGTNFVSLPVVNNDVCERLFQFLVHSPTVDNGFVVQRAFNANKTTEFPKPVNVCSQRLTALSSIPLSSPVQSLVNPNPNLGYIPQKSAPVNLSTVHKNAPFTFASCSNETKAYASGNQSKSSLRNAQSYDGSFPGPVKLAVNVQPELEASSTVKSQSTATAQASGAIPKKKVSSKSIAVPQTMKERASSKDIDAAELLSQAASSTSSFQSSSTKYKKTRAADGNSAPAFERSSLPPLHSYSEELREYYKALDHWHKNFYVTWLAAAGPRGQMDRYMKAMKGFRV